VRIHLRHLKWPQLSMCLSDKVKHDCIYCQLVLAMTGDSNLGDHDIEIDTHNGNIEVTIPETFSLEFELLVIGSDHNRRKNYTIKSDFDLKIVEKEWRDSYEIFGTGKIGDGKHKVYINTTNGDIIIKKN